jgi:hypothetical protein
MNAKDLKQRVDDRVKINKWLDSINETDEECRAEVLQQCKDDPEARAYYVGLYERDK